MKFHKHVLVPDRVRKIEGSFSFIPHNFVTDGFFTAMTQNELLLYFLLVIVGDRNGLSYYSQDRLAIMLKMPLDDFISARNDLINKSLIAFDGLLFQVLSLPKEPICVPSNPLRTDDDFMQNDPLTIRRLINTQFANNREA